MSDIPTPLPQPPEAAVNGTSTSRKNVPVPDELAQVRAAIKQLEERENELKRLLIAHPDIRTGAHWIAEVQTVKTQRTDLKELRHFHPEIVDEFTLPITQTRVVLSGIDDETGEIVSARKMRTPH